MELVARIRRDLWRALRRLPNGGQIAPAWLGSLQTGGSVVEIGVRPEPDRFDVRVWWQTDNRMLARDTRDSDWQAPLRQILQQIRTEYEPLENTEVENNG